MITKLIIVLLLILICLHWLIWIDTERWIIEPKVYYRKLLSILLFLRNSKYKLNQFLTDETYDEDNLVKLVEQIEFQINDIQNLITHYKRLDLEDVKRKVKWKEGK